MNVLVTGASGFVGSAVVRRLAYDGKMVRAAVRRPLRDLPPSVGKAYVANLDSTTDWSAALRHVDVVVHASARVHVMRESVLDPLAEFRRVNVEGTIALARASARAGVKRLIFISSVKVNGERTLCGRPFTADDVAAPLDAYGVSKFEAEQALHAIAAQTGLEIVIIRPVLIYGPGVKGNFLSMMRWLRKGIPLPFGAIQNRRSLIALDNLVDLIDLCLSHPGAAGQVFLAADGADLSTPELLRLTANALECPARLIPVPVALVRGMASMVGMAGVAERLCGSLQADIGKTQRLLAWRPPVSTEKSVTRTAQFFLAEGMTERASSSR